MIRLIACLLAVASFGAVAEPKSEAGYVAVDN